MFAWLSSHSRTNVFKWVMTNVYNIQNKALKISWDISLLVKKIIFNFRNKEFNWEKGSVNLNINYVMKYQKCNQNELED